MNQPELSSASHLVSLNDPEATLKVIKQVVIELWDVINALTRLRPPKRARYRVTIFGSGRVQPSSPIYQDVKWLASQLTLRQCDIVTGGGAGLMAAANEGSVEADPEDLTRSIGIRIALDLEQETNPFVEQVFHHRTFFSRLHQFVLISNAFVVVPGGIGTTLEALMIWQLLQVRHLQEIPLILVGSMWQELIAWANRFMLGEEMPFVDPKDLQIPYCVATVEEAMRILEQSHIGWLNNLENTEQVSDQS